MTIAAMRIRIHRAGYAIWPWVKEGLAGLGLVIFIAVCVVGLPLIIPHGIVP